MEASTNPVETQSTSYQVYDAKQINILLLGKSGQGKSTILKILQNPKESVVTTRFSQTREAYLRSLAVMGSKSNFVLNIIDTPGLFEVRSENETSRSNDELLNLAWKCLEKSVTKLHAIVVVYRYGRITQEDLNAIRVLKGFLQDSFPHNVIVAITGVEKLIQTPERLKNILSEMGSDAMKELSEFCENRFLFMGASSEDMVSWLSQDKLEKLHNGIISLRQYFIDHIISLPECYLPAVLIECYNEKLKELRKQITESRNIPEMKYDEDRNKQILKTKEEISAALRKGKKKKQTKDNFDHLHIAKDIIQSTWNLQGDVQKFSNLPEEIYKVIPAKQKNILIIGKSGAGKSTLIKFLENPRHVTNINGGFAATEFPTNYSRLLLVDDLNGSEAYNFHFIDTPGLFEVRHKSEEQRANSEILDMIEMSEKINHPS